MFKLYIKTISLLIFGQQKQEFSILIKEFWKSKFRVILSMIRLTNSYYKQLGGPNKVPNVTNIALGGNLLYVIGELQEWSNAQGLSKTFNAVENLRIVNVGKHKNSGYPENQEIWGYGGVIIRSSCSDATIRKNSSLEATTNFVFSNSKMLDVDLKSFDKQITKYIKTGKRIEGLSNIISNSKFLLLCYYKIKLDYRMLDKNVFNKIAKDIRIGSYNFYYPVKRKLAFKLTRKEKFLDIASLGNRIVQEAIWQLLKLIYEKISSNTLYKLNLNKSRHAVLDQIQITMKHSIWFIEGDMSEHFNIISYDLLVSKINSIIKDQSFINLVCKVLYTKCKFPNKKISSCLEFQRETIISLLLNIFLYNFDIKMLEFSKSFNKSAYSKSNLKYTEIAKNQNHIICSKLLDNVKFKEFKYVRYINSFLIGVIGSKKDCINIRLYIQKLLKTEFEFNVNKIKITYAKSNNTFFLGCNICVLNFSKNELQYFLGKNKKFTKTLNKLQINIPIKRVISVLNNAGYCKTNGSPTRFGKLVHKPITEIILKYKILQSNLLNHYSIANNYKYISIKVHYILKYSCALTIASKMKLKTLKKVFTKFGTNLEIKDEKGVIVQSYPTTFFCSKSKRLMKEHEI